MNRYSRVLHHISICDVKKTKLRLENNRKSFLESVRRAREFLRDLNSPYYSDWRNTDIKEGMTTGSVFFTTFPATGSDTNLETIAANDTDAYTGAGGLDALNGASVKASGSGSGTDGGFDLGQSYLAFDGNVDSRHAILDPIDSSKFDTLVINAIVGNDSNGGEDPDEAGEELRLYYLEPGGSSFRSISVNPNGEQVLSANADVLIDLGAGDGSLQQFSIGLPSHARGEGFTYMLYQLSNSGEEFDHYGITSIKYQRRNPISLAVSLDSPEAVSMIRDGGNLTPAEKKKRLEDMLAASDEYMETQFPTNQEAMRRAEENLRRNIDISLDPNTFKFPEVGAPTYNQMFDAKIKPDSSTIEIDRALRQKGLDLDNLKKGVVKSKGEFTVGREETLTLINNPYTQERALTALGIPNLGKKFTPDSYKQIEKITNLRPGGTPSTGWDGKFYESDDPQLEASQVIPLETFTRIKGTDDFAGIEKPDRVEPGKRYVIEKKYSFTPDNEATPNYVGVRNKDIEQRINNNRVTYIATVGGNQYGIGGHSWDYGLYTDRSSDLGGSEYMLRELAGSATKSLNYINQNSDSLAYEFLRQYQDGERGGVYKDFYGQYKETDILNNYDPLWIWNSNPKMSDMLTLLRGISSGRSLDSPLEYYTSNVASAESKRRAELNHQRQNDRLYDNLQKALKLFDSPRTLSQYEKDEWYLERDNNDRVTGVRTTHPYADMMSQQQPQPSEPDDSYMNIQVGDEQIIKQGNETILDTMRGIDNRQKNAIESELDRIKKMPPDVRGELERLLNVAGTSEYTPTSPKTKKEIEDYWASLPPEVLSDIEGRTQASGVDAIGLAVAVLAGLALGASGVGAALTTAFGKGLSKIKNLTKGTRTPTKVQYPKSTTSTNQSLEKTLTSQKTLNAAREAIRKGGRNANITVKVNGKPFELKADHVLNRPGYNRPPSYSRGRGMGDRWEGPLSNSYRPEGDPLMDNYEPKAKHNEKINNHPKIKSPKEFFKKADIKPVYPDTPPPEMINGRHPDLVDDTKIAKRFTKLDPESAKAMPNTGSPQIDALVRSARKKPK